MSEDSLSDDSNLSSTSLLKDLIEASLTELSSFTNLTFEEKFKKIRSSVKTSFLLERDPTSLDSYEEAIEEFITRTARDRRKSFLEGTIPRLSERGLRDSILLRPNINELQIPLMSRRSMTIKKTSWSDQKPRRSGYVGELLNYMDRQPARASTRHPSRRRSSIHLAKYKFLKEKLKKRKEQQLKRYKDHEKDEQGHTKEQKEIIEEVSGGVPERSESELVSHGRLSYLQSLDREVDRFPSIINIFPQDVPFERRPSYDDYFTQGEDLNHSHRVLPSLENVLDQDSRHSMWEREQSLKSVKIPPPDENVKIIRKQPEPEERKPRKSVRFSKN